MNRKYNFCPGPCCLPQEVMLEAQSDLVNYQGSGLSLLEMSHRGECYTEVHHQAQRLLREVLSIPEEFAILLLQGGATLQYPLIAMNLLRDQDRSAAYVLSGIWSQKSYDDARLVSRAQVAWDGKSSQYHTLPKASDLDMADDAAYLYFCANETIGGLQFDRFPQVNVPLVGDMSSEIVSRPIDWSRFDLVYGGMQKNMAPSGAGVVIVRRSKLDPNHPLPSYFSYAEHLKHNSLMNTPPTFCIWMLSLTLKWVQQQGGLAAMQTLAQQRSDLLYQTIDESDGYYRNPIEPQYRSKMNVVFRLPSEEDEQRFLAQCEQHGLENLAGHRSVGGIRASIYNGMPLAGVERLAEVMRQFKR